MGRALTVPGLEGHTINKECLSAEEQQSSEKSPGDATNLVLVFPRASATGSAGGSSVPSCDPSLDTSSDKAGEEKLSLVLHAAEGTGQTVWEDMREL